MSQPSELSTALCNTFKYYMPNYKITVEQIDNLLPQTQCTDCGYNGCKPYAQAIINQNENIDLCLPGGLNTLKALAHVLEKDSKDFIGSMELKAKKPMLAIVNEEKCIGCTKCIQACPVDAIVGAPKQLHAILENECTGCGLCLPPCPIDCIDLKVLEKTVYIPQKAKERYQSRNKRLTDEQNLKKLKLSFESKADEQQNLKKMEILAVMARAKKKNECKKDS